MTCPPTLNPEDVVTYVLEDGTQTTRRAKYIDWGDPNLRSWWLKSQHSH